MPDGNPLGAFLRWHRHRLTPARVGLPDTRGRRVPGLRREEVAGLAGISREYYIRLEQGRERSPSVPVLDALAEALQLDADQAAHLHQLARPRSRRRGTARQASAPEGATRLVGLLPMPAVLLNRYMDVLAANSHAESLFPNMRPGTNRIRAVFLDPDEQDFWVDWADAAADSVAQLRADLGFAGECSPARAIIDELEDQCPQFRRLWARQDVNRRALSPVRVRHPGLGEMELHREKLIVAGTDGIVLYVYFADPQSPAAEKLAALTVAVAGHFR